MFIYEILGRVEKMRKEFDDFRPSKREIEKRRKEKVYCRYQLSLILHGNKSPQQRYRSISHPRPSLLSSTHFATTPWPVCAGRNRPFREYRYSMFAVFWLPPCGIITVFLKQKERGREGKRGGKSEVTEGEEKKRSVAHYLERSCFHKNVGSNCLT